MKGKYNMKTKNSQVARHDAAKEPTQITSTETGLPRRAPRLKVIKDGDREVVSFDDTERAVARAELAKALASENVDFCVEIVERIAKATSSGDMPDEHAANFVLSVIAEGEPRDVFETMQFSQIGTLHLVVMDAARQYRRATTTTERHIALNDLNKAARTFSTQLLALKNYRAGSPQTVTVQNVSVSDGGQAIVGNVTAAPRGTPSAADPPPVTISGSALPLNDNQKVEADDVQPLDKGEGNETES